MTFLLSTDDDERMQQKARLEDDLSVASERLETLVRGLPPSLSPSLLLCLHSSLPLSPPLLLHLHSSLPLSVYPPFTSPSLPYSPFPLALPHSFFFFSSVLTSLVYVPNMMICSVFRTEHKDKLHSTLDTFEKIDYRVRGKRYH